MEPQADLSTLADAHCLLTKAAAGVRSDQWELATPCEKWNVTQVLQHAVGDQRGYAMMISGADGPTYDPFAPSGELTESVPDFVDSALQVTMRTWESIAEQTDAPTPLPQGVLPMSVAIGACALDAAVHAWDIAVATGQAARLTTDLAEVLLPVARAIVPPLRDYGVYAAEVESSPADDSIAVLLHFLGRHART